MLSGCGSGNPNSEESPLARLACFRTPRPPAGPCSGRLQKVVAPPEILTTLLPIGVLGSAYEATLLANGGTGSYTWLVTAGELPTGLALSADGVIAGQPTAVGEFTFTLQVSSGGKTASGEFNVSIQAPPVSITSDALANAVIGTAYTQTLTATGGDGTYAWSVNSGDFPDGLALAPEGTVSGTPTALGEFRFSLKATSAGQEATGYFIVTVVTGDLGLTLDGTQFELIPAGSFEMGSETGQPDESPVHSVTITRPFYVQKTEVTQAQWQAVMGENPSHFSSCGGMCPVDSVSWDDVQEFISRVNQAHEGMNYRLPTEAEWEYAARAGTTGDWGGTGNVDEMAWHLGNGRSRTHPVGLKEANAWGLHDMHGNVSEWVQDWYDWEYYKASPTIDPTGPATGTQRVLRGGDITSIAYQARSAWRGLLEPTARSYRAGFRLVKSQ